MEGVPASQDLRVAPLEREITALTRNDLDLERRTVRIRRQFLTMVFNYDHRKSRAGIRMVSFPAAIPP